ncbi:4-hydroxy-tetrahydrodipicolinate synthase [Paraburkholderia silviterrae]|uniref:4-hydroxy-tetrahydrodipicolinate synthase n=1 Tax=Paraburkholderia silviterrae TaxID=2528715 RepID=A0A4R5MAK1_9BURK|nr:4-hydroxy-tetrahydrodipicolinate synthase [Paraburkholderia silviterrae]TDG23154.1 4-hydroxy-tetrahydrodipicolinate synthase [Paraburkholderia silviterrae]
MNQKAHPIRGSIVALVTPMHNDGSLDLPALRELVDWHVASGTAALVAVGTTGESPTVSVEEHLRVIEVCVEHAGGRIPVIAGSGANSTAEAIELTKRAGALGASASLQVVPYYNKPTQEGLYRHFRRIAEEVDLPVILYNVPGRTGADLQNDTVLRLAQVPGIVGIKDATGDLERGMRLLRAAPTSFGVYSGDDATAPLLMLMGGRGNISVTANVMPRVMAALCDAALAGDAKMVRAMQLELVELHHALFAEANPIPVKWLLARRGKMQDGIRLPLTPHDTRFHSTLMDAFDRAEAACEAIVLKQGWIS